ncbi:MAG TPA: NAD(P)-binding domain-containing protein [Cytophagales bacterium]|nr:NAD(P)-binding domain-containing protein [Cytophagales bacterium]
MNIGIIGAGEMGSCLAASFVRLGHKVSLANSRGPASLKQRAQDIGAEAVNVETVIKNSKVIVVSIPVKNVPALPTSLFKDLSKDVVVIDTGNYYPSLRDGVIPALERKGIDSLWVQEQLGVPVVKVFNSILATSVQDKARPQDVKERIALTVSGDNDEAKKVVFGLVDALGFDSFDSGSIGRSWMQQPGAPIYCRDLQLEELIKRVRIMESGGPDMLDRILAQRKAHEVLMRTDYAAYLKYLQES